MCQENACERCRCATCNYNGCGCGHCSDCRKSEEDSPVKNCQWYREEQ